MKIEKKQRKIYILKKYFILFFSKKQKYKYKLKIKNFIHSFAIYLFFKFLRKKKFN